MKRKNSDIRKFDSLLTERLCNVLLRRSEVWDFVKTEHTDRDATEYLYDVREFGKQISDDITTLLEYKTSSPQHEKYIEALLDRYEAINKYLRETQDCLNDDIRKIQKEKDAKKIDRIKNATFLFGLPIGFIASVHNGLGEGQFTAKEATIVGFAISIPIVFEKSFRNLFQNAAKDICDVPQIIRNDLRVYCATQMVRQCSQGAQLCFATAAKSINDNVKDGGQRMKRGLEKVFGRAGPKL